jgi:energy-coupling factor transporter ATP-binding protein EcfA2
MTDFLLCGWRVRSAVPLPEVLPWTGDDREPDIDIRFGPVPVLTDLVGQGAPAQVARDGTCRLEFANIGCFRIFGGREVTVEPYGRIHAPEFHATLLGPVLGVLIFQRNLFPLHAACVRIGGGAVALTGRTGVGKSTLAAALVRRGHPLIADDVCVIDPATGNRPFVLPSFPRLKLWDEAVEALQMCADDMPRAQSGKRKYHFYQPGTFDASPVELRQVYHLDRSSAGDLLDVIPEYGAAAVTTFSKEIYRRPIGFWLGRGATLLTDALHLAARVRVFRVSGRSELRQLSALAAQIEAHVLSQDPDNRRLVRDDSNTDC